MLQHLQTTPIMKKRLFFSFLFALSFCHFLVAQGWENFQTEDNVVYRGSHIIATTDGNYVACGFQSGTSSAEFGSYVVKISEDGQQLWKTNLSNNTGGVDDLAELPGNRYLAVVMLAAPTSNNTPLLFRVLDADGNVEETFTYDVGVINDYYDNLIIPQSDGGFVHSFIMNQSQRLIRYDADFNLIDDIELSFTDARLRHQKDNGDLIFVTKTDAEIIVHEVDLAGTLLDTKVVSWPVNEQYETLITGINYANDEFVFTIVNEINGGASTEVTLVRLDDDLNQVDSDIIYDADYFRFQDLTPLEDGFLIGGIHGETANPEGGDGLMIKTDLQGNVEFVYGVDNLPMANMFDMVIPSSESGYLAVGATFTPYYGYVVKVTEDGQLYSNLLNGILAVDDIPDCQYTNGENLVEGWMIMAEKDNALFAVDITDELGNYSLQLDEGDFVISVLPVNNYWGLCENNIDLSFTSADQTTTQDFLLTSEINCPEMTVNASNIWMVPCTERTIYLDYCNNGTTFAPDASIVLTLSENLEIESSSLPWDTNIDNVLTFNLGDVGPLDCGAFTVEVSLPCDAPILNGYVITAQIFPNENCNPDPGYMGAFLESHGVCNPNEVTFLIQNTGTVDTESGKEYFIVEDAVLMYSEPIPPLTPNEIFPITIPANGSTLTLIHDQVELAPQLEAPIAIVEGCGTNDVGDYSTGFDNQFPQGDLDPYIDQDRARSVNDVIFNSMHASPNGYGTPNYIAPNTSIEFYITFENRTSNTVNNLNIQVPLNEFMDLTSMRNLTSSHDFDFSFNEGMLNFFFSNIALPSSDNSDEGEGYLSFRMKPKANTALGTVIFHSATIQFDSNNPINTNQNFHTLGEDFVEILSVSTEHPEITNIKVKVLPNPIEDFAIIEVQNHEADSYTLEIYTTDGKLISTQLFENNNIQLQRNQLKTGMYIYKLTSNDGFVNTGRIIFK